MQLGDSTYLQIETSAPPDDGVIRFPEVDGVDYGDLRGPSVRENAFTDKNGRWVRERYYIYYVDLSVGEAGEYVIPPITAVIGGREVSSDELRLRVTPDTEGAALGYVDVRVPFDRVVVGQTFPIEIEYGCRASYADRIGDWNLSLPWLEDLGRGAVTAERPDPRDGAPTQVTVGRSALQASAPKITQVNGEAFRVMRLRLLATPMRSGKIDLSGTVLRFVEGRWVENLILGRDFRPTKEYFKRLGEGAFTISPLPEEDRPLGFTGAVGTFDASASADVRDLFAGDSIKLTVDYTGAGNLADFGAPDLSLAPEFTDDFAIYGSKEDRGQDRRRIVYDIAPLRDDVERIPSVSLETFDPSTWEYRRVSTQPIDISVRPRGTEAPITVGEEPAPTKRKFERDIEDVLPGGLRAAGTDGNAPSEGTIASVFGAVIVAWGALRFASRRDGGMRGQSGERRGALRRLERGLSRADTPEKELRAWTAFLAARTGVDAESWVGRDVRGDSRRGFVDLGEVATDLVARTNERLEAAAYGDGERVGADDVLRVARDLLEEGL
ncbi:MAG: BatD family protein [Planctomycetota bacterium]